MTGVTQGMDKKTRFELNEPSVVSETIEGESVIINLDTGIYYSMQRTAAAIWEQIEQRRTVGDILDRIKAQFVDVGEDIDAQVQQFLKELVEEALVREAADHDAGENSDPAGGETGAPGLPFERPMLNRYSDMADLLLLDPIHEVDETGWPQMK